MRLPPRREHTYTSIMKRHPTFAAAAIGLMFLIGLTAGACRSSSSTQRTPTARATSAAIATAAASPTKGVPATTGATTSIGIRQIDVKSVPDVKKAVTDSGGQINAASVVYADVTGDGIDEAIVPVSSGGTMGDIGFLVLSPAGDATKTLLKEFPADQRGLSVALDAGKIVMTQPVPGPDDPNCCPSMLRRTTYAWNGAALAIESVQTETNPNGGAKPTSSSGGASP